MLNKILVLVPLFGLLATTLLSAQVVMPKDWSAEKIEGSRYLSYDYHSGNPFLSDKFVKGEIEFLDGKKIEDLQLRYSEYRDELIYFNTSISAQIIIDKTSLRGFSLTDELGIRRIFRQQYYTGYLPGNRFFEVLDNGEISLLAYRLVILESCITYRDINGRLNSMSYDKEYSYYLYNPKKGYQLIKITRNSLLSLFAKSNQILVKKILRKNKLYITDESSFVKAWNLVKENGIKVNY